MREARSCLEAAYTLPQAAIVRYAATCCGPPRAYPDGQQPAARVPPPSDERVFPLARTVRLYCPLNTTAGRGYGAWRAAARLPGGFRFDVAGEGAPWGYLASPFLRSTPVPLDNLSWPPGC